MTDHFCTNCGNAVSEQAVACMSCGAKPIGQKKFCRQCGVGLNPEQVVCIKCGAAVGGTAPIAIPINGGTSNIGFVWMYLIWLLWGAVSLGRVLPDSDVRTTIDLIGVFFLSTVCLPVAVIIWTNMKDKASLATVHGKNILNANFSYCLYCIVVLGILEIIWDSLMVIITMFLDAGFAFSGVTNILFALQHSLFYVEALVRLALSVLFIVSTIQSAIAANEGNVKPYLLSIPFLKIQN